MIFAFYPDLPADIDEAEVISGDASLNFNYSEYLVVRNEDEKSAFKIIYGVHCSPFRDAAIINDLLLVGYEAYFYLYNLKAKRNLLALEMNGYFGHLYINNNYFYVADAESLYCVNNKGEIIWYSKNLGIDGVVIEKFTESKIFGSGEWNPPGGWIDFVLDIRTGYLLNNQ